MSQNKYEPDCQTDHGTVDLLVLCDNCEVIYATATMSQYTFKVWIDDVSVLDPETVPEKVSSQVMIYTYVNALDELPTCDKCNKQLELGVHLQADIANNHFDVVTPLGWPIKKLSDTPAFVFKHFTGKYEFYNHKLDIHRELEN